ncbi:unnamed protein product [Phytophthora lilii]|uniref:Unnamed protein product n=1 Tax=Phytophthora lilii TaxID=2077276 RepID=A0A9W6X3K4_9STRA|nr:unnamed protein product [Phytophthora lilii]
MQLATVGGATDRGTIEDESGPRSDDPRSSSPLQLGLEGDSAKLQLNPKLITIEKFSGAIRDGYLDAGANEWLDRLKDNIADAETFNDRTWPEQAKCSALTSSLIGTWYLRNWDVLPRTSFTIWARLPRQVSLPFPRPTTGLTAGRYYETSPSVLR